MHLLFYTLLENFPGSQVKGSITLLMVNMSQTVAELTVPERCRRIEALANQFGYKNSEK
jgi:hypothetical protein